MKIEILLEREPFGEILERTLERFLTTETEQKYEVTWLEELPDSTSGLWLCNPRINSIYGVNTTSEVFSIPWREYLKGPTLLRTLGQLGYLFAATSAPGRSRMATHFVRVSPEIAGSDQILILGGNSRLRWIDFRTGRVLSILKEGFDPSWLRRELEIRKDRDDLLSPPILDVLDDGRAYVEPLIRGTVADRLFSSRRATAAVGYLAAAPS